LNDPHMDRLFLGGNTTALATESAISSI